MKSNSSLILVFIAFLFVETGCDTANSDVPVSEFIVPFEENQKWYYKTERYENSELNLVQIDSFMVSESVNELGKKGWRVDPYSSISLGFYEMILVGGNDSLFTNYPTFSGIDVLSLVYSFPESLSDTVEFGSWKGDVSDSWHVFQIDNPDSDNNIYVFETNKRPKSDTNYIVKVEPGVGIIEYNSVKIDGDYERIVTATLIRELNEIE